MRMRGTENLVYCFFFTLEHSSLYGHYSGRFLSLNDSSISVNKSRNRCIWIDTNSLFISQSCIEMYTSFKTIKCPHHHHIYSSEHSNHSNPICRIWMEALTLLSSSLAAEKYQVLFLLRKCTTLKGNTLLEVVSSAALITLPSNHNSWKSKQIHPMTRMCAFLRLAFHPANIPLECGLKALLCIPSVIFVKYKSTLSSITCFFLAVICLALGLRSLAMETRWAGKTQHSMTQPCLMAIYTQLQGA